MPDTPENLAHVACAGGGHRLADQLGQAAAKGWNRRTPLGHADGQRLGRCRGIHDG